MLFQGGSAKEPNVSAVEMRDWKGAVIDQKKRKTWELDPRNLSIGGCVRHTPESLSPHSLHYESGLCRLLLSPLDCT